MGQRVTVSRRYLSLILYVYAFDFFGGVNIESLATIKLCEKDFCHFLTKLPLFTTKILGFTNKKLPCDASMDFSLKKGIYNPKFEV